MAEKPKEHKPKHKKPHKIITTRAEDGSFGHEHVHKGESTPIFAGTSRDMNDLHQHMDDHFGEPQEAAAEPAAAPAGPAPGGEGEGEPE